MTEQQRRLSELIARSTWRTDPADYSEAILASIDDSLDAGEERSGKLIGSDPKED